jgi:hypothetical protein
LEDTGSIVILGVMLFVMLGFAMGIQWFRTRRSPIGKVIMIASDLRHNVRLCESAGSDHSTGRFRTGGWEKHWAAVDFLPEELRDELSRLNDMLAELNGTIDAARMHGSNNYMATIDVSKVREPLTSCQEQVQNWVFENMNNPEYRPKKRSLFRL